MWGTVTRMATPRELARATLLQREEDHMAIIRKLLRVCGSMPRYVKRVNTKGKAYVQVRVTGLPEKTRNWLHRDVKRVHAAFGSRYRADGYKHWARAFTFVYPLD